MNIGNPIEYTVREVAELILELSGSPSEFTYKPLPEDDPKQRCPDITRAKEGLSRTLRWFAGWKAPKEIGHTTK